MKAQAAAWFSTNVPIACQPGELAGLLPLDNIIWSIVKIHLWLMTYYLQL